MKSTDENLVVSYLLWAGVQAATAASASMPKLLRSTFHGFLVVVMGIGYTSSQFLNRIVLDNFSPYWCFLIYQSFVISSLVGGGPDWTSSRFTSVNCGSDSLKHDQKSLVSLGHVSFVGYGTVLFFFFLGSLVLWNHMLRWEFWPSMMMGCNICVRVICAKWTLSLGISWPS